MTLNNLLDKISKEDLTILLIESKYNAIKKIDSYPIDSTEVIDLVEKLKSRGVKLHYSKESLMISEEQSEKELKSVVETIYNFNTLDKGLDSLNKKHDEVMSKAAEVGREFKRFSDNLKRLNEIEINFPKLPEFPRIYSKEEIQEIFEAKKRRALDMERKFLNGEISVSDYQSFINNETKKLEETRKKAKEKLDINKGLIDKIKKMKDDD